MRPLPRQHRNDGLSRLGVDRASPVAVEPPTTRSKPICKRYRIGEVAVYANCRGVDERERSGRPFVPAAHFDL